MDAATASPTVTDDALPPWLRRYTTAGLYGLLLGTVLCLLALFTNPVPDPSFPWATLPAAYRLPLTQPRIEHWPVSYTVGIWLWILGFPALFLEGYQRTDRRFGSALWLVALPTASMFAWTTYCRFFWPKLHPPTWNAPSYTVVCWLYCSSYDPIWSTLAYAVATLGLVAVVLDVRRGRGTTTTYSLAVFGVLALPLGLPALFEAYRRRST